MHLAHTQNKLACRDHRQRHLWGRGLLYDWYWINNWHSLSSISDVRGRRKHGCFRTSGSRVLQRLQKYFFMVTSIQINPDNNNVLYGAATPAVSKLCQHSSWSLNGARFIMFAHTTLHCLSVKRANQQGTILPRENTRLVLLCNLIGKLCLAPALRVSGGGGMLPSAVTEISFEK